MRFATAVYVIHICFELLFGANAFLSGGSSSQSAEQIAAQSAQATIAARFLGSALIALGVLGALVLFGPGVRSPAARIVAIGLTVFHGLGTLGILLSAFPDPSVLQRILTLGAFLLHGGLAIGFGVLAVFLRGDRPPQ